MITVTGKIENAAGETLHARIDFLSRSTPLVGSGVITTNTDKSLRSNPETGEFAVPLAPGNYQVVVTAQGQTTQFTIAVPAGDGDVSIEDLTTTPLLYPFLAPNTVWNGIRAGHLQFEPIADPPAPVVIPVNSFGGNQGPSDQSSYQIGWATPLLDVTAAGPAAANSPPNGSGTNATRVFLPAPPPGIAYVRLYRSIDGGANFYLHQTLSPSVTFFDDVMSNATFSGFLNPALTPPAVNTTAGKVLSSAGNLRMLVNDQGLLFPGTNARIKPGLGLQLFNSDTGLWHTLLCTGNPPQLGLDAGQN